MEKYIYQLSKLGNNTLPSLIEQSLFQARDKAKEISMFLDTRVVVRHPRSKEIIWSYEKGISTLY